MLGSVTDTNTRYVDHTNNRVYTFDTGTGKTYPQAQAACAAITYAGVTGKGYLVSWNTWVAAQAAGPAKPPLPAALRHMDRACQPAGWPDPTGLDGPVLGAAGLGSRMALCVAHPRC